LQLIPEQILKPYLDSVKQLLLEHCPLAEKRRLLENFSHIGKSDEVTTAPIAHIYRQTRPGETESEIQEAWEGEQAKDRRLTILWERLKSEVGQPGSIEEEKIREESLPHLLATAASNAQSGDEFRSFQETLKSLGIGSRTDQIFRTLSHSLPGWMIPTTGADAMNSRNPAIEAMQRIISLAEDRREGCRRFQDMVQAAIEQFNAGSLARAATMFDLALGISSDDKLDPDVVAKVRRTAHESLSGERLRALAKEKDKHRLLQKVLGFFDEFSVKNLLDSLEGEEQRERRWLLLGLLESHADAAREMASERLKEVLADTNVAIDWYFARNLVHILNSVPPGGDFSPKMELELVAPLLRLSLPVPLIKEAIKRVGQIKCSESEELLISTADTLERVVFEHAISSRDPKQKLSLLDRTVFTLAHYGTPRAYAKVVKHGISRHQKLGDTAARLEYLSGQDLSEDKESLALLIRFLKSKTPRRIFGLTIQKNDQLLNHAVVALSSTLSPIVRETFKDIAARFPETKSGQAAASALREFEASDKPEIREESMISGDLELFGLPDLLRQLSHLQVTGTLTLTDTKGNAIGAFTLHAGRSEDCSAGHLKGKEAACQLLEKPIAGNFLFQGQRDSGMQEPPAEHDMPELDSMLSEGMRRYDELERARAVVPDFSLLRRTGLKPAPLLKEEYREFSDLVWQKTATGVTPEECEAICAVDSYHVRTLLASWIEEGVLTAE
ncbi:MAG: hypothetical protein H6Q04_1821, partial [Acidobacteria bacterium]|nr:hypothetical protein [Acidobacteriota bacterium]